MTIKFVCIFTPIRTHSPFHIQSHLSSSAFDDFLAAEWSVKETVRKEKPELRTYTQGVISQPFNCFKRSAHFFFARARKYAAEPVNTQNVQNKNTVLDAWK